jgi:predicted N-acyltransferase
VTNRRASFLGSVAEIDAPSWNALAGHHQPFLRHEFLLALEESGCTTPRNGWTPEHLVLKNAEGRLIGAMPLFRKGHSRGEFVFDFSWANAYAQHGLNYYPKLLSAVPFTPVRGVRLLVEPVEAAATRSALIEAACDRARTQRLSSCHVLFPSDDNVESLNQAGLILRQDCQFHCREAQEGKTRAAPGRRSRHRVRHPLGR